MKTLITSAAAALAMACVSATAQGAPAPKGSSKVYESLADYVYPANRTAGVARPCFVPGQAAYLQLSADGRTIVKHDLRTGAPGETVLDLGHTRLGRIDRIVSFSISPDGGKLLVATSSQGIYRRSTKGQHYVYELRTRILTPLSDEHPVQRAPVFSPDGRMVAFVADDNNIWLKKLDYGTEVAVTTDGCVNAVINGVPDWVYEEEFSTDRSMAWAPDCLTLCYLKYNEEQVPLYSFPLYEGACQPKVQYALYPGAFTYKYPVAGEPNSRVSLHSYDIDTRKTKDLPLPGAGSIEYIPSIHYGHGEGARLYATTLDRDQRHMEIVAVNPRSGLCKSIISEKSDAWIAPETYEQQHYLPQGILLLSARTGWTHAYLYSYEGQLLKTLSQGEWDVKQFYGTDSRGNSYMLTTRSGCTGRVLTRVDAKGVMHDLSPARGCASAWFSPLMDYYCLGHSTASTPPVYTLYAAQGDKKVRVLEDNAKARAKYSDAPVRTFTTLTTPGGITLNAWVLAPQGAQPGRKYPLIVTQYSGPGSQQVLDRWETGWEQWASAHGYGVLCVDPRGTGGRGRAWETAVYKQLGQLEGTDLRGAATAAAAAWDWVDPSRIGLTGWSYGGYQTLMTVSDPSSPYACAVAIAPVTDWRYYDTVYAERYMLTPQQNAAGYASSAPLTHAGAMDIPLLIMHGTADDNVHLLNTIQYVSVLESHGRMCDMLLYPNMNHSIYGCDSRLNVYSKMMNYFDRNL